MAYCGNGCPSEDELRKTLSDPCELSLEEYEAICSHIFELPCHSCFEATERLKDEHKKLMAEADAQVQVRSESSPSELTHA